MNMGSGRIFTNNICPSTYKCQSHFIPGFIEHLRKRIIGAPRTTIFHKICKPEIKQNISNKCLLSKGLSGRFIYYEIIHFSKNN